VSAPAVARMAERILSARGIPRLASQRKDEEILEREG
jgi:hypothetical protein